jgi:hypothetical protein
MLTRWREIYDNKQIQKGLGVANSPYYKMVEELEIPKKPRGGANNVGPKTRKSRAKVISPEPTLLDFETPEIDSKPQIEKEVVKLITRGLHLEYNGQYDVDALSKLFTKLQLLIDGDSNKYNISLSLSEICED